MRKLNAYEINHLLKFGFDPTSKDIPEDVPVEYITGKAEFYGRIFEVNKDTLIPRVETEEMIEVALGLLATTLNPQPITFADIGTGSGCIGITFALELEKLNIEYKGFLSDISDAALEICKKNISNLIPTSNLKPLASNLFENYPKDDKFDLVFANLPYIPSSRIENLDKSVKEFEPRSALDGGKDGLEIIAKLLDQAKDKLNKNGAIILEVDDTHTKEIIKHYDLHKHWEIEIKDDVNGKNRFWVCRKVIVNN